MVLHQNCIHFHLPFGNILGCKIRVYLHFFLSFKKHRNANICTKPALICIMMIFSTHYVIAVWGWAAVCREERLAYWQDV